MNLARPLALALLALTGAVQAQSEPALEIQGTRNETGSPVEHVSFEVKQDGAFVSRGFVRDVGNTTGCAPFHPAGGAGTVFFWHPCRGSVRFGRVPTAQTNWDDANMDDFTFAGGNQVTASGYGAFAYGDQVTVSSTVGVGFGSGITVSGTAGFSAGAANVCSGFACTAIGYTNLATGQGSVALGYRTGAVGDYTVALGYRARTCYPANSTTEANLGLTCVNGNERTGAFVWGDESTTNFVQAQANNEFRIRAAGGVRLRTSAAANNAVGVSGNTGCDLPAGSGTFSCSSSRTIKENFADVSRAEVLQRLRELPIQTWNFTSAPAADRHLGPVAEDFFAAFGLGTSESSIGVQDLAGIGLVGVQALADRSDAIDARVAALEAQNAALLKELSEAREAQAALMSRLENIESVFGARQQVAAKSE